MIVKIKFVVVRVNIHQIKQNNMRGLGKWEYSVQTGKHSRLKARKKSSKKSSKGKSLLPNKGQSSSSGESAAVHFVRLDLARFGDKSGKSDNDLAVVRTVETLSVAGSDVPASGQEKEARSSGGIPSR